MADNINVGRGAEIFRAMAEIERLVESDGYYLTRDEQDSIFYRLQSLKEHVGGIYGKKA